MSLSFRITSRLHVRRRRRCSSASKAMPAVIAPSPMTRSPCAFSPLLLGRHRHAQRRGDAGGRVRRAEGVVFAFAALRKARQAAELAQAVHAVAPAGEDLVRVGLVAHVPDDAVVRRVEHVVQRDRQLHRAEVGAEVAAGARHAVEHELAQLVRQRGSCARGSLRRSAGSLIVSSNEVIAVRCPVNCPCSRPLSPVPVTPACRASRWWQSACGPAPAVPGA